MSKKKIGVPGRTRRRIGLGFIVLGVMWTAVMLVSIRWWFGYCSNSWLADIGDGTLYVRAVSNDKWSRNLLGWSGGENIEYTQSSMRSWSWTWWVWSEKRNQWDDVNGYSVWPVAPLLLACGLALFLPGARSARRMSRGLCVHCAYSREGLPAEALCPECGKPDPRQALAVESSVTLATTTDTKPANS